MATAKSMRETSPSPPNAVSDDARRIRWPSFSVFMRRLPMRDALRRKTVPAMLADVRARRRTRSLPAEKLGVYRERTWRQYAALVGRVADGLAGSAGARERRDHRRRLRVDARGPGGASARPVTYGIYPTASAAETVPAARRRHASWSPRTRSTSTVLPIMERLPLVRHIVVIDTRAMFGTGMKSRRASPPCSSGGGRGAALAGSKRWRRSFPRGARVHHLHVGHDGASEGALCSHGRHLAGTYNIVEHYPLLAEPQRTVVYLPLSHGLGRDIAITLPLICGLVPHFGEDVEDLGTTLFEVAPTVLFTVPRYLQKFASRILVAIMESSPLKRRVHEAAMAIGRRMPATVWGSAMRGMRRFMRSAALVFRPVLNKLGFDQLRLVVCAGAAAAGDRGTVADLGREPVRAYGQTEEAGALISGQRGPCPGAMSARSPG